MLLVLYGASLAWTIKWPSTEFIVLELSTIHIRAAKLSEFSMSVLARPRVGLVLMEQAVCETYHNQFYCY